ncbi:MAG: hypothetical protein AAF561_12325 [Planctomycetota bacterium]
MPCVCSSTRFARRARALTLLAAFCVGFGGFAAVPTASADYPQPGFAPKAWEFDLDYRQPQRVVLRAPNGQTEAYWYLAYTVTNDTEQERTFLPDIVLVTRTGEVLAANDNIPMGVFEAIRRRTPGLPLVAPQEVFGRLLIGEDRARSSVAIWREPLRDMGTFQIFVAGLNGDVETIESSDGSPMVGDDGETLLVRKTKRLGFRVLGDGIDTGPDSIKQEVDEWVMR